MSPYLSYWWPIQIMGRFVKTETVLSNLTGWGGGRVFVLAAECDRLMSLKLMGRMADEYREQRASMVRSGVFTRDGRNIDQSWVPGECERTEFGGLEGVRDGIAYRVVEGAGHHRKLSAWCVHVNMKTKANMRKKSSKRRAKKNWRKIS